MITMLNEVPGNIAAFRASGNVTKEDYQLIIQPAIENLYEKTGEINFLLYLDSGIENFTNGTWYQEIMLRLKNLGKWNRAAIVTDFSSYTNLTTAFSPIMPGEFKGFTKEFYGGALDWVSQVE